MGVEESSIPIGSSISTVSTNAQFNAQIIVSIHGARRTGKTTLISKMKNEKFRFLYTPTPTMEATEVLWTSSFIPVQTIKVTLWEVVDRAIMRKRSENEVFPDATSVNTYDRTDGIIVMYDTRSVESMKYAETIIENSSDEIPILCLGNFVDMLPDFNSFRKENYFAKKFKDRINHAYSCIPENRGLSIVSEWLNQPLEYSRKKYYSSLLTTINDELDTFQETMSNDVKKSLVFDYGSDNDDNDFDYQNDQNDFSIYDLNCSSIDPSFKIKLDYN